MRAWNDLKYNPDIYLYTTSRSVYWIENGVKIERMNFSGNISISNCMTPGDDFECISKKEMDVFLNYGWTAGMYNMCINNQAIILINARNNVETSRGPKEKIKRQRRYDFMLTKFKILESKYAFVINTINNYR